METRIRQLGLLTALLLLAVGVAIVVAAGRERLALLPSRARTEGAATPTLPSAPPLSSGSATARVLGPLGELVDGMSRPTSPVHAYEPLPSLTPAAGTPIADPTATATIDPRRVGIIPGHWGYDSGAVCEDGLLEVDVTTDVALRAQAILDTRDIAVDLLEEHDPDVPQPPLQGYRGAALVSIHADSCQPVGASGFRATRWPYSSTPEQDDRLLDCLYARYGAATMLPRHDTSITIDMWNYYAFREIHAETPAAIIELAFLGDDRAFVDAHRYSMALGVADAISCFLDGQP